MYIYIYIYIYLALGRVLWGEEYHLRVMTLVAIDWRIAPWSYTGAVWLDSVSCKVHFLQVDRHVVFD